jgi:hypothetical protein
VEIENEKLVDENKNELQQQQRKTFDTSKRAKAPVLFYVITSIRNHWLRTGMIPLCLSLSIINAQ